MSIHFWSLKNEKVNGKCICFLATFLRHSWDGHGFVSKTFIYTDIFVAVVHLNDDIFRNNAVLRLANVLTQTTLWFCPTRIFKQFEMPRSTVEHVATHVYHLNNNKLQ